MIKNILFPVDFSQSCIAMAPFVKRAAALLGARVTLLHCCDLTSHNGFELYVRSAQEIGEEHWDIGRRKINSFMESEFPAATCPRVLCCGDVAEQIAATAAGGFDLIVMPTHGGRFRRMLLGSTTAKVLNDVNCPVLTAEHMEVVAPKPLGYRQWVCALALNADSERVLNVANGAAGEAGANLLLVHAVDCSTGRPDCSEMALCRLAELQTSVGCNAEIRVVRGPVKEALLEATRQASADLLIVGRPLSHSLGRIDDLTYGLIRDSPCPVLSV
jgi:nucleotide-binding universal stress UspA family protein